MRRHPLVTPTRAGAALSMTAPTGNAAFARLVEMGAVCEVRGRRWDVSSRTTSTCRS